MRKLFGSLLLIGMSAFAGSPQHNLYIDNLYNVTGTVLLATSTQIGRLAGVTGNIQAQLNALAGVTSGAGCPACVLKAGDTMTGSLTLASTSSIITTSPASILSQAELSYLDGVTSGIQAQLNSKMAADFSNASGILAANRGGTAVSNSGTFHFSGNPTVISTGGSGVLTLEGAINSFANTTLNVQNNGSVSLVTGGAGTSMSIAGANGTAVNFGTGNFVVNPGALFNTISLNNTTGNSALNLSNTNQSILGTGTITNNGTITAGNGASLNISPSSSLLFPLSLSFPSSFGSAGQTLTTDGAGGLSWTSSGNAVLAGVTSNLSPLNGVTGAVLGSYLTGLTANIQSQINPSGARYLLNSGLTLNGPDGTVIDYPVVDYDTDNSVTTGAAWKYTVQPGKAGTYLVVATIQHGSGNDVPATFNIHVNVNGAAIGLSPFPVAGQIYAVSQVVGVTRLVAGDFVQIEYDNGAGTTNTSNNQVTVTRIGN